MLKILVSLVLVIITLKQIEADVLSINNTVYYCKLDLN